MGRCVMEVWGGDVKNERGVEVWVGVRRMKETEHFLSLGASQSIMTQVEKLTGIGIDILFMNIGKQNKTKQTAKK